MRRTKSGKSGPVVAVVHALVIVFMHGTTGTDRLCFVVTVAAACIIAMATFTERFFLVRFAASGASGRKTVTSRRRKRGS